MIYCLLEGCSTNKTTVTTDILACLNRPPDLSYAIAEQKKKKPCVGKHDGHLLSAMLSTSSDQVKTSHLHLATVCHCGLSKFPLDTSSLSAQLLNAHCTKMLNEFVEGNVQIYLRSHCPCSLCTCNVSRDLN